MTLLALFSIGLIFDLSSALICYKSDFETGETVMVSNSDFVYCVSFHYNKDSRKSDKTHKPFLDGVTKEELEEDYGMLLNSDTSVYSVLSLCLFEKYDWAKLNLSKRSIEFQFRCLCDQDLCNGGEKFEDYLENLKHV
uniref:Uncharacterized protein n=1 Tax=Acrobeloides nanus TaxID=290746 RepID=A0A914DYV7_9BILA